MKHRADSLRQQSYLSSFHNAVWASARGGFSYCLRYACSFWKLQTNIGLSCMGDKKLFCMWRVVPDCRWDVIIKKSVNRLYRQCSIIYDFQSKIEGRTHNSRVMGVQRMVYVSTDKSLFCFDSKHLNVFRQYMNFIFWKMLADWSAALNKKKL